MKTSLRKYTGTFEFYHETGMECNGVIFHDDRGLSKAPSFNNETKKYDGPEQEFKSLNWALFLGKHNIYKTRIFNADGSILYEGPLTIDRSKVAKEKYTISFLPKEMSTKEWLSICIKELRAELYTNDITEAEKNEYKVEFRVGEVVNDDLTSEEATIINITFDKNKNVGYWLNNDYLEGGRHPWEITKINWNDRLKQS